MEMRGDDIMTDNQYYGILKMILSIIRRCKSIDEAEKEIESFLRDRDKEKPGEQ